MNDLLELIIKKQVNILLINTFTNYMQYNAYIFKFEQYKDRNLTQKEFKKIKKAVKEYGKQN